MKQVTYTDKEGKRYEVLIPDDAPDSDAAHGVIVGPSSLANLKLPKSVEVLLHNQLHSRGILTASDAKRNRQELVNALMATLKVDAERIISIMEGESGNS